jgi:hypothetical protein
MYGSRSRKVKTDRRDVAALAEANRTGVYRVAHRASADSRRLRQRLRVRAHVVQLRSRSISLLRALLRQDGLRLPSGSAETIVARVDRVALPAALADVIAPLRTWLTQLNATLADLDQAVRARAAADATAQRLMSAPGVGPVVALTFQAVMDTPARFGAMPAARAPFSAWSPPKIARPNGSIEATSRRPGRAICAPCSCRPVGSFGAVGVRRAPRCGRGRTRWPRAAGAALRLLPWRAGYRGFSMRCGATSASF